MGVQLHVWVCIECVHGGVSGSTTACVGVPECVSVCGGVYRWFECASMGECAIAGVQVRLYYIS